MILDLSIFEAVKITKLHCMINNPRNRRIIIKLLTTCRVHHTHTWNLPQNLTCIPVHQLIKEAPSGEVYFPQNGYARRYHSLQEEA